MYWLTNWKVIGDLSQFMDFQTSFVDVILMEHCETPPGYVLLKLLTPKLSSFQKVIVNVTYKNSRYISSEKFRKLFYLAVITLNFGGEGVRFHGPCTNVYFENHEWDFGMCFACQYWPQTALSWFDRCQNQGWPVQSVLKEIMSNGCHVMPIACETYSNDNELEWRISFSLAEQKMVYSMNHTVFVLWSFKDFLERGALFNEWRFLTVFLLYENHSFLGDSEQSR